MKKIVLTGGGTAGHVTPNLALIPRLKADGWEIHYIGAANSAEEELITQVEGVSFHTVSVGKLRRYFDPKNFSDPFRVINGIRQATGLIHNIKPSVVFSKGGFVSVPVVYGAKLNGVPVVSHESDMTPGLANKLCLPFAKVQCCTFPEAGGLRRFGLNHSRPVLMVMGGSSGAQAINQAVWQCLPKLTENFQVLHLCGKGNFSPVVEGTDNYVQVEYLTEEQEMADAYACADILVSRAGSNSLCEILAVRKPALLIPYPKDASRGDQILNAESFRAQGFSHVLQQEDMTPESLVKNIEQLYHDRGVLYEAMATEPTANGIDKVLEQIYKYAK